VSVCVPTYKRARSLEATLRSLLGQTVSDFEILVGDNSPDDESARAVSALGSGRIRHIRNETNVGMVENWNRLVRASRGDYVLIIHDDDRALPGLVEAERGALDGNPGAGFVHTAIEVVDEGGKVVERPRHYEGDHAFDAVATFKDLYLDNKVSCPTVMVRRECYERTGLYDHSLPFAADWDMWLRIALAGYGSMFLSRPLLRNKVHAGSATSGFASARLDKLEHLKMLHKTYHSHLPALPVDRAEMGRLRRALRWKIAKVWTAEYYRSLRAFLFGRR